MFTSLNNIKMEMTNMDVHQGGLVVRKRSGCMLPQVMGERMKYKPGGPLFRLIKHNDTVGAVYTL